ncbi:hypothetical protein ACFWZA_14905 [[Kitasatospora] papulosa]|uniref:hypothetical protein n=1 Tax=[Kitasatospora] papulosa TaxID=1464011 RepID=UPI0036944884
MDDHDTVQGCLLIREFRLTHPEERLTDRLRRQFLTGNDRSQSGQRGPQLSGSRSRLSQGSGPFDRSGMGCQPCQHARGVFRLSIDARAQHRSGSTASGLTEDSDSRMIDSRR